tara:strand:+ start:577 stop:1248 length:672 start_codon:yes stop_codon:yes gene_type:complete
MPATVASLYEQLFPLTTVMKQRVVENFSGDTLDTDRWATHGSGSYNMGDSVDGGLKLISPNSGAQSIDFAPSDATKKRPFNQTGSVMIVTSKMTLAQYSIQYGGFRDVYYTEAGSRAGWSTSGVTNGNSFDNKIILLGSGTAVISVDTSIASGDIHNWHTYKLELSSGTASLSIDGVLSGTGFASGSSNPSNQCTPYLNSSASEGTITGGAISNFTYFEAYNT